ncbi:MAG: tripartite tricarboxylate transporter TctB family protein [Paracoccaceae bacterium]|nr:tripartite tricarboxylate transporter TctB family protein [Paracoccaceae bacterium]
MGDRALGSVGLGLAAAYVWQASRIQESFISDPIGPKGFPFIIGGLLALTSLAVLLRPDPPPHWPRPARLLELVAAVAVMVAYALFLPDAGFVIATAIASAYFSWRLGASAMQAALAGVAIAGGIYLVFHLALGLNLAKGPLGF